MSSRPAWTLTEAVQRTGSSRSTLRRYLDAGKFPNAYKDSSKAWRFPLEDLLAAGLTVSEPPADHAQRTPSEQSKTTTDEQVNKLEQALRAERTRADNAEILAASYLNNVHDLRRALLMIEASTGKPEQPTEHAQNKVTEHAQNTQTNHNLSDAERPSLLTTDQGKEKDRPKPVPIWRRILSRR